MSSIPTKTNSRNGRREWRACSPPWCRHGGHQRDGRDGHPQLFVGPLKVRHHYSLTLAVANCSGASVSATFTRSFRHGQEIHSFSATRGVRCHLAGNLSTASLRFAIGKLAKGTLQFHPRGRRRHLKPAAGCSGSGTTIQNGSFSGTGAGGDPAGLLRAREATAGGGPAGEDRSELLGGRPAALRWCSPRSFLQASLFATAPPSGPRSLELEFHPAKLGKTVSVIHTVELSGGSVFSVASTLASAHVGGVAPVVTGGLTFAANPACPGQPNGRTGAMTGTLEVHLDVGGTVALADPAATALTRGNASPCAM